MDTDVEQLPKAGGENRDLKREMQDPERKARIFDQLVQCFLAYSRTDPAPLCLRSCPLNFGRLTSFPVPFS